MTDERKPMAPDRPFPIMGHKDRLVKSIPWWLLNEEWAQRNHSQSLSCLAERGGLDAGEAVANIKGFRWGEIDTSASAYAIYEQILIAASRKSAADEGN